jgi:hypothetical protein
MWHRFMYISVYVNVCMCTCGQTHKYRCTHIFKNKMTHGYIDGWHMAIVIDEVQLDFQFLKISLSITTSP